MISLWRVRIGVTLQAITQFFLGRFLELHGIGIQEVSIVDVEPARFIETFTGGGVDALVAWQPYSDSILRRDSDGFVLWPAQCSQAVYGILASRSEWLARNRDTLKRFLTSLSKAEDFILRNPDGAKAIVQARLNYDSPYIESVWPQHRFSLSLDETLIVAMIWQYSRFRGAGWRFNRRA